MSCLSCMRAWKAYVSGGHLYSLCRNATSFVTGIPLPLAYTQKQKQYPQSFICYMTRYLTNQVVQSRVESSIALVCLWYQLVVGALAEVPALATIVHLIASLSDHSDVSRGRNTQCFCWVHGLHIVLVPVWVSQPLHSQWGERNNMYSQEC